MRTLNFVFPRHLNRCCRGWQLTLTARGRWWCHSQAGKNHGKPPMAAEGCWESPLMGSSQNIRRYLLNSEKRRACPGKTKNPNCSRFLSDFMSFNQIAEVKRDTSLCPRLTKFRTTHVSLLKLWDTDAVQIWGLDPFIGFSCSLGQIPKGRETCQCRCFHSYSEAVELILLLFQIQPSAQPYKAWSSAPKLSGAQLTRHTNHWAPSDPCWIGREKLC